MRPKTLINLQPIGLDTTFNHLIQDINTHRRCTLKSLQLILLAFPELMSLWEYPHITAENRAAPIPLCV